MSSPRTFSGFNGDDPMSSSYKTAGRKFANRFSSLRKPRMPCSGRNAGSRLSYFQTPVAPTITASAFCAGERRIGQWVAAGFIAGAANRRFFELEGFAEAVQHLDRLG